jgi:hypothetical protein
MSDIFNCLLEEQALFNTTQGTKFACLTRGDSIGLTLAAEAGFISLVALLGVFALIMVSADSIHAILPANCCCSIAKYHPE